MGKPEDSLKPKPLTLRTDFQATNFSFCWDYLDSIIDLECCFPDTFANLSAKSCQSTTDILNPLSVNTLLSLMWSAMIWSSKVTCEGLHTVVPEVFPVQDDEVESTNVIWEKESFVFCFFFKGLWDITELLEEFL